MEAHILFVIMDPQAPVFVPDIHTDPAFSRAPIHARGVGAPGTLSFRPGFYVYVTSAMRALITSGPCLEALL